MDLVVVVAVIAALFAIIGLCEPLADRLRLPFSVILAVVGIAIAVAARFLWTTNLTDALNEPALAILNLPIRSSLFLNVFLPILIFQVTLDLNIRRLMDDWVPVLVLAVLAVVVATLVIGFALLPFSGLPLAACLLVGAVVSTTDPSAVVAIFRNISAPRRLSRIVEGESLLNDAAAIALAGVFLGFVTSRAENPSLAAALAEFPWLVLSGLAAGGILARAAIAAMGRVPAYPHAQMSISIALPFLAYIVTDELLGGSGVIAVVVAGLVVNLLGPGRLSPESFGSIRQTWEMLSHWAGSLIFMLAALLIPRLMSNLRLADLGLILVVTLAAFLARAVILFAVLPALTFLKLSPRVDRPYRIAILWGGLRGAVTLSLALAVTENLLVSPEIKRQVAILATGFVLFTLIVQGTTLRRVIAWLGLDRLSNLDVALSHQVLAVALQNVRETVAGAARDYELTHDVVRDEAKQFGERLESALRLADEGTEIPDRDRVTLGLVALAGRERDLILERFREKSITASLAERMLTGADRLIERTRAGGRTEYRSAARRMIDAGPLHRPAMWLHHRFDRSPLLARVTADRFETLVMLRFIQRDLHDFIDRKIRRIHGKRVAELLHDLLDRREEETRSMLDGMRRQFPGYAELLERRLIRLTALSQEEAEYETLRADGLIGSELSTQLVQQIGAKRARLAPRPPLDLARQKAEFIRRFPAFAGFDDRRRAGMARAFRMHYADPGEVLFERGTSPRRAWLLVTGTAEALGGSRKRRLGKGEIFGHLGPDLPDHGPDRVQATTWCALLSLDEPRFTALVRENAFLRRVLTETAGRPGARQAAAPPAATPPAATPPVQMP